MANAETRGSVTYASMLPPAASSLARAEAESVTPCTVYARSASPVPSSFTGTWRLPIRPAAKSVSGLTTCPVTFRSCRRLTAWAVTLNGLVNPRFGSRRCGPCGPCGPCRRSCRAPSRGPAPTACAPGTSPAPGGAWTGSPWSGLPSLRLGGRYLDEVAPPVQHPPDRRRVPEPDGLLVMPEAERLERAAHG